MSLRWKSSFVERSIQINRPAIKRRSINSPLTSDVELEDMADFLPEIMVAKAKVNTKDSNFTHINDSITRKNDNMVGRSPDTKGRLWQNPFPTIENICKADHSVLHGNHASINSETASPISDNSVEVTNISLLQPDSHSTVPLIDVSDNNSKLDGLNNLKKVENSSEFISAVIPSEALEDPETQIESQEPVMLYERALRKISLAVADKIEALSKELGVVKKGGFRSVEEHSKLDLENGEPNNLSKSKVSEVQAVRKTNPPKKVLKKADSVVAVKPLFKILNGNPKAASQAVLLNDVTYHSRIIPTTESKGTKSKSLNELMRLSRASSVSSSSESDSFKEILANPDPVPGKNRPPYSHRKEENPQKVFVKKWTKKKFRRNPLTKLGMSKYDLLSITAGVFTGPGDIYHKFIFGGASIRENAIILKEKKIIEIDKGKMDKVIADASRAKTGVYHRVVETSREKLKVATCNSIDVKVAKLEELRAYIITTINKINSSKGYMVELEAQNNELAERHSILSMAYHKQVADTIESDDSCTNQIQSLETIAVAERSKIMIEFGALLKEWKNQKSLLKSNLDEKAQAYNAAVEDMNDLLAFNYNISIDPDYTKKEFIKALRDVKLHEMELRQRLEDFKFNFRAQELEYKAQEREIGHSIFKRAMEGYESYVDSVSLSLFQRQTYLKDEVLRQRRAQYELIEQIKSQTALKHLFERQISTEKDPRRQVRQLPTFMDCKSDIKITIR